MSCTVEELRNRITEVEFKYWYAFYYIEGLGYKKDDHLVSRVLRQVALSANANAPQELQDYSWDPYGKPEWEDEELMDEMDEMIAELEGRKKAGEFDYMKRETDGNSS
jgi:hypothetical protein